MHKTAIVNGFLMHGIVQRELKKDGAQLPISIIEKNAEEQAGGMVRNAMLMGTLDNIYNDIWEKVAPVMPEHLKIM